MNTDTNYVDIGVIVTSPGPYQISTGKHNGVQFDAKGIFTDTGLNTVRLRATGSFITPRVTFFTTTFDTSSCQFQIDVQDSTGRSLADNTWQFSSGGQVYQGIATAGIYQIPDGGGISFQFVGSGLTGSLDTTLSISAGTTGSYLNTGSHLTSAAGNGFSFATATDPRLVYTADLSTVPAVIDVNITSITGTPDSLHAIVIGTFNGTTWDTAKKVVPITNARFKIRTTD